MTNRIPVISWFQEGDDPRLLGNTCKACGDYYFPRTKACRNPKCMSDDLEPYAFSNEGVLWSYSTNFYPPPKPFVPEDPFVPYTLCVVTLEKEELSVVGQLAKGYTEDQLKTGMKMQLVVEPLYVDDEGEHTVWKWKPVL